MRDLGLTADTMVINLKQMLQKLKDGEIDINKFKASLKVLEKILLYRKLQFAAFNLATQYKKNAIAKWIKDAITDLDPTVREDSSEVLDNMAPFPSDPHLIYGNRFSIKSVRCKPQLGYMLRKQQCRKSRLSTGCCARILKN